MASVQQALQDAAEDESQCIEQEVSRGAPREKGYLGECAEARAAARMQSTMTGWQARLAMCDTDEATESAPRHMARQP